MKPIFALHNVTKKFGRQVAVDDFYGASSMERLPTEIALTAQVEKFTQIRR